MIRVVPDTNILISSIFWKGKPYQVIKGGFEGKYRLILSAEILAELINKLSDKFTLPQDRIEDEVNLLFHYCDFIEHKIKLEIVKDDPSDNKIIECAISGAAHYIVTGDPHLKNIKEYKGIKIVSPDKFLSEIKQHFLP
ncbi:putative toxin-antitoxin system toxin component, PIN family [Candidatus Desantisbacteria bacterium CG1_02_38_46]|nr:MAG: putative toxin-antitoxin system toxin component, PIN family [Candidatus Desantisbacteria bacterium CG1_02_38_46]